MVDGFLYILKVLKSENTVNHTNHNEALDGLKTLELNTRRRDDGTGQGEYILSRDETMEVEICTGRDLTGLILY